ncbi:hypothetical protein KC19_12G099500 [Ceratodon purpureus]|nr:hypothetical protein KC19_12G099500 [Ceratodon purpureus]
MAFPKHGRHERRGPSTHVIIFGSIFVAFLLIGAWVYTSPTPIEEVIETKTVSQTSNLDKNGRSEMLEQTRVTSSQREREEEAKELEAEEAKDADSDDKMDEVEDRSEEVTDEPTKREEEGPEVDESTILDKSMEEAKAEEAKAQEAKSEETDDIENVTSKVDNESGDSEAVKKDSKLEVAGKEELLEEKTGKQDAEDLPPTDSTESETNPDSGDDLSSSWKSQDKESKEEKEVIKNNAADEGDPDVVPEVHASEETEAVNPTEEEKKIAEDQKLATTPIVIQEEVAKTEVEKYKWKLCNWSGAQDYIPCLDNKKWLSIHRQRKHYEHRERHCPTREELPKCLVPLPPGYKAHIKWPESRSEAWYDNVPHVGLVQYKKDQNWVKKQGEKLIFPGGGTQFKHGAGHYIDWVQKIYPAIGWGKHTRVLLDVGCGVASFGGYLYDRDVLAMSFAPKDEHEAQVQLALERGIPAFSSVMGTQRLVFPSNSFDVVHCARCRVPWHVDGGMLLLELNRVLRPGGHFLWSATPVYQDLEEDKQIWKDTIAVIEAMGWKMKVKETDEETQIGVAIFQKPLTNEIYETRTVDKPEMCSPENNAHAAWYVKMEACIHKIPDTKRSQWPEEWPLRATAVPSWLDKKDIGLYGKPAPDDFLSDTEHWERVVSKTYMDGLGIDWSTIRNVMDMKAGYGGFAAALVSQKLWVLNIVPITEPDTLPIIYDRGMIGMYHDWCEPHSTYPRTYDLLHADHLISSVKEK